MVRESIGIRWQEEKIANYYPQIWVANGNPIDRTRDHPENKRAVAWCEKKLLQFRTG
jgi:hypothetical protein